MISISSTDIYNKVLEFASFEAGRSLVGDDLYHTLLVTSRDKPFISTFSAQAQSSIGTNLHFCLEDYYTQGEQYCFDFRSNCALAERKNTKRLLTEAMTLSVMSQWLANKLPERAQAYASMYTDLMSVIIKSVKKINPLLY